MVSYGGIIEDDELEESNSKECGDEQIVVIHKLNGKFKNWIAKNLFVPPEYSFQNHKLL